MRRHATPLIALFLAACASVPPAPPAPETPAEAVQRRTEAPRPQYKMGWNDGFSICGKK